MASAPVISQAEMMAGARRQGMVALRTAEGSLEISNDLMNTALNRHLKVMDERNIDVQMISARHSAAGIDDCGFQPVAAREFQPVTTRFVKIGNRAF